MARCVGNAATRLCLEIQQGSTFGPLLITVVDPDNSPVDLTGCSAKAQIRRSFSADEVIAEFVTAIEEGGIISLSLAAETTATIEAGPAINHPKSRYVWDLDLTWSDERIDTLLSGEVAVWAEVTRATPL